MFTNNYIEEAEKVVKKICPKCNRAMKESMPHEKDDPEEPICYTCNIYWTIIGNHACENGNMIKEKIEDGDYIKTILILEHNIWTFIK